MININKYTELTNINPDAKHKDIKRLCEKASTNDVLGICVNPEWVDYARRCLKILPKHYGDADIKVVQVYNFPTSKSTLLDGDEVDVLMHFKGCLDKKDRVAKVKAATKQTLAYLALKGYTRDKIKVVIETHLLNDKEIVAATKVLCKCKVGYVKSSTGVYARLIKRDNFDDLELIKKGMKIFGFIPRKLLGMYTPKIKISGGVRAIKDAEELIKRGATVIGTSKVLT